MPTNSKEYVDKNRKKYWKNDKTRAAAKKRMKDLRAAWRSNKRSKDGKELDHVGGLNGSKKRVISQKKNRQLGAKKAIATRKKRQAKGGKY